MERFVRGDIVVVPFPFSDLSATKKRPALVLANIDEDYLLCQITSKYREDKNSVMVKEKDFKNGKLERDSFIKAGKIFTAYKNLILYRKCAIKEQKTNEVIEKIIAILKQN